MNKNNEKGITLIALVVTIIVLLILAGTTIAMLVGENGILSQAKLASIKTKEETAIEEVKIAWSAITADYILATSNSSNVKKEDYYIKDNLNKELINKGEVVEFNYNIDGTATLMYVKPNKGNIKEKYYMKIETNGNIRIINKVPLEEATIEISDIKWKNGKASVEMTTLSEYKVQYQINSDSEDGWIEGTNVSELNLNDVVYARLWNGTERGVQINKTISDTERPNEAEIELSELNTNTISTIIAKVEQTDSQSGVNIEDCRWIYEMTEEKIGENQSDYPEKFTDLTEDIELKVTTPGTYWLHILTVDKAGNKKETVSSPVIVNYTSGWEKLIAQGLKPEQIVNDTSNLSKALENEKDIEYVLEHTTDIMPVVVNSKVAMEYIGKREDICNKIFGDTQGNVTANTTWINAILNNSNAIAGLDSSNPTTVPNMTGYTTPSGEAKASSEYSGSNTGYAWTAFNSTLNKDSDAWHSADSIGLPQWIQYKFNKPVLVYKFYMQNRNQSTTWVNAPKDFSLLGSNDGINWDTLGTYQNTSFQKLAAKTYVVQTINKRYIYYRICVYSAKRTDGVTDYPGAAIGRIQFYGK